MQLKMIENVGRNRLEIRKGCIRIEAKTVAEARRSDRYLKAVIGAFYRNRDRRL